MAALADAGIPEDLDVDLSPVQQGAKGSNHLTIENLMFALIRGLVVFQGPPRSQQPNLAALRRRLTWSLRGFGTASIQSKPGFF